MLRYVNPQAVDELFAVVDAEHDPQGRADMLTRLQEDFINRMLHQYERTAYELKKQGWNTGQIADLLDFSERRIKRMIIDYSERTGAWNPLRRMRSTGAIDISHLVMRQHNAADRQASPSRPVSGETDSNAAVVG